MKGHALQVFLLGFVLITACNKDEFVGVSTKVEGLDAQCSAGTDIPSCEALSGCQVAYEDVESVEPVFAACIANPEPEEEVVIPRQPDEEVIDPVDPVVPGNPGKGNNKPKPNDPVVSEDEEQDENEVPSVDDAIRLACDIDEKYLYIKSYTKGNQSKRVKKVKLCHHADANPHAIIVACPSLNAHRSHDDYLGACRVE